MLSEHSETMSGAKRLVKTNASRYCRQGRLTVANSKNFFSRASKAPSVYTVAAICKVLGISLDEVFGISEHLTPTEETLQARNDELERHVDAKADMIEIMRRGVRIRNVVIAIMFVIIVLLAAWCLYIDWRGI